MLIAHISFIRYASWKQVTSAFNHLKDRYHLYVTSTSKNTIIFKNIKQWCLGNKSMFFLRPRWNSSVHSVIEILCYISKSLYGQSSWYRDNSGRRETFQYVCYLKSNFISFFSHNVQNISHKYAPQIFFFQQIAYTLSSMFVSVDKGTECPYISFINSDGELCA